MVEAHNQWDFLSMLASMGVVEPEALQATIRSEAQKHM